MTRTVVVRHWLKPPGEPGERLRIREGVVDAIDNDPDDGACLRCRRRW
ncbi:hypothetical protein [Massilia mucilaginosa]|nr:hypothetical protein [Massilia mucilaginosa]